jgi:hypothetical protein
VTSLLLLGWAVAHTPGMSQSTWLLHEDTAQVEAVFHRDEPLPNEGVLPPSCVWTLVSDEQVEDDGRALRWQARACSTNEVGFTSSMWAALGGDHRHQAVVHDGARAPQPFLWSTSNPHSALLRGHGWMALLSVVIMAARWLPRRRHRVRFRDLWMMVAGGLWGFWCGPLPMTITVVVLMLVGASAAVGGPSMLGLMLCAVVVGMQLH